MLNDLMHWWGGDLSSGNTGDLATVSGTLMGEQRVLRRLVTNPATATAPADYIWEPTYGAGLRRFIGSTSDSAKIVAVIRAALALESVVAKSPAPVIEVAPLASDPTGFTVSIAYNDAPSGTPVVLSFDITGPAA